MGSSPPVGNGLGHGDAHRSAMSSRGCACRAYRTKRGGLVRLDVFGGMNGIFRRACRTRTVVGQRRPLHRVDRPQKPVLSGMTVAVRTAILRLSIHITFEETMFDATTESLAGIKSRQHHSRAKGRVISVSDHGPRTSQSSRFNACAAPFLACSNSIMQGEDGVARCNSPFLHCQRYVYSGDPVGAASSSAAKNRRESMTGTK